MIVSFIWNDCAVTYNGQVRQPKEELRDMPTSGFCSLIHLSGFGILLIRDSFR